MEIIVQKFGGSSVANTDKLFNVCKHITKEKNKGNSVVVVVSAQGDTTDDLIKEENEITEKPNKREHDVLVSVGEQITIAKLAMCLQKQGYEAVSMLGWQVPIITDSNFGDANITKIKTGKILKELKTGKIVIIAGFQGIDSNSNITTLGRGGSDTTAIALASALKAKKCEIFTDVDGVYSEDPNKNENATKFDKLTYDKMLEMANNGAKVLHNKCVKLAKEKQVKIIVKSTFLEESVGTVVEK
jgi:aspartate kinase